MKTICTFFLALLGGLALSQPAFSQSASSEADVAASVAAAQQQYVASFTLHPQLWNGPEYLDYAQLYHTQTGHQFFTWPKSQPGSAHYNDHYFPGLLLAYDVVREQVVLSHPDNPLTLRLINEKVSAFSINGHRFIRLVADSSSAKVIHTGFYEVLLDSTAQVQVLAKRTKRLQEHLHSPNVDVEFTQADKLFIRKNGTYFPVSSKSSVTRLFSDKSKEIQAYIRDHALNFSKAQRETTIRILAGYYSSLVSR
jgi:hypothetical protein